MLSVTNKPFKVSVVMLSVIMLSVIMLSVVMLSAVMLSVVMLSVMAPLTGLSVGSKVCQQIFFGIRPKISQLNFPINLKSHPHPFFN
jgi:hypothetical protein